MADIERIINLLLVKGSEGDGSLHLNKEDTQALADYVRRLRKIEHQTATQPIGGGTSLYRNEQYVVGATGTAVDGTTFPVVIKLDGREMAKAVMRELPSVVRNAIGPRTI